MKIEIDIIEKLTTKYKNRGIILSFHFNEFGLIIKGYRGNHRFNRIFSYDYLQLTKYDIYKIVDEFVLEFESNITKGKEINNVC